MVFGLLIWFALCLVAANMAKNKGRNAVGYFCLSALLTPIIGILLAAAAGPKSAVLEGSASKLDQDRKCPHCAEFIKREAVLCRFCSQRVEPVAQRVAPASVSMQMREGSSNKPVYVALGAVGFICAVIWLSQLDDTHASRAADLTKSGQTPISKFTAPADFTLVRDGYVIKGSSFTDRVQDVDITLKVFFKKRPSQEKAYSILATETAQYVRQIGGATNAWVTAYEYEGQADKSTGSSQQVKDTGADYYVTAWFDQKTNSIMKGNRLAGQAIFSDVLPNAQAQAAVAAAKVREDESAKQHEQHKLVAAAASTRQLVKQLRDPKSLTIDSLLVTDKDGMACISYRAKNGFGGMNRERAVWFMLGLMTESDKDFSNAWNHWCADQRGTEEGPYATRLIEDGVIT